MTKLNARVYRIQTPLRHIVPKLLIHFMDKCKRKFDSVLWSASPVRAAYIRRDCTETEISTTASTTSASTSLPARSWQSSTTDTGNDTSASYSTTAGPTANVTTEPVEQHNDTLDDDSLNGINPANDSSTEYDFETGENETVSDGGTTNNSMMPFNNTTHGNESRNTIDVSTTINPDLDYNTSLISSIVSTASTEGYSSNTT